MDISPSIIACVCFLLAAHIKAEETPTTTRIGLWKRVGLRAVEVLAGGLALVLSVGVIITRFILGY